jgi:hypothetical protein
MKRAFDDADNDDTVGQIGMLMRAGVLGRVELPFGPVDRDGQMSDPALFDVFVFEVGRVADVVPVLAERIVSHDALFPVARIAWLCSPLSQTP